MLPLHLPSVAMNLRPIILALLAILPAAAFQLPANSTQCLVGTADGWDNSTVTLRLYHKKRGNLETC